MRIVILYSGGLDSLIMRKFAEVMHPSAEITLVYFDIGHGYNYKEIAQLPSDVIVKKIDWLQGETGISKEGNAAGSVYFPGRNLMFVTAAACMYTPDEIWLGTLCGEEHKEATDKNEMFRSIVNTTFQYVLSPYNVPKVKFPFVEMGYGKLDITEWALNHGFTAEQLTSSSSCMSSEPGACGECLVCARRWGIFSQLGLEEKYRVHPLTSSAARKHMAAVLADKSNHYDEHRKEEFLKPLQDHFKITDVETIIEKLIE